ncbi:MAG: hypothetical protein KC589_00025 [Nanoarchaeota archaeon]|nr:hypothetical protein [Nanoarchaeota archaeon]
MEMNENDKIRERLSALLIELKNREFVESIQNRILKTRRDFESITLMVPIGQQFSLEFDRSFGNEFCSILVLVNNSNHSMLLGYEFLQLGLIKIINKLLDNKAEYNSYEQFNYLIKNEMNITLKGGNTIVLKDEEEF